MNGRVSVQFTQLPKVNLKPHLVQNPDISRSMFSAAESNLTWIEGFGTKGLKPIARGLHWVHSPYYVNHLGITLPSGAFCMIKTTLDNNKARAIESHEQRLKFFTEKHNVWRRFRRECFRYDETTKYTFKTPQMLGCCR